MTIAITGATGQLGRLVVQALRRKVAAPEIVALARDLEKAAELGVAARQADYDEPGMLTAALEGVDTLLLISGSVPGVRVTQHANVLDAAKRAGVGRIVYTSVLHADVSPLDIASDHRATEDALRRSGMSYTILRHGWYTENYMGSLPGALASGALVGSAGGARISSSARADYAEADATVLVGSDHAGQTYELAGDEAWTMEDLAAELSARTGDAIPYRDLPPTEYVALLTSVGLPDGLARAIAGWDVAASQGALFDDSRQLSRLIGRPTTPLRATVADALRVARDGVGAST